MSTHTLWVIVHFLAIVVFINRYIAGIVLRVIRTHRGVWDETRDDYEPTVTVIVPMYNEGPAIKETLQTLLNNAYPHSKLKVICVDDCSTDESYEHAREIAKKSKGRLIVLRNATNQGKRRSIIRATREAEGSEIVISVDSDVIVDKDAVRQLVRRFVDDRIAAVGGWVDVRNKHDNWLSKMQTVKYWYGYFFLKNIEWGFRRIMCLSGCLTAYRRSVLIELEPVLEHRSMFGVPIKYGEDRFLTRQIIKAGYYTTMTLTARAKTFVPTTLTGYFSQQLRWRRSTIVDYFGGFTHIWRLNPIIAIHFLSLFALLLIYPIAVIRSLAAGKFFPLLVFHCSILFIFGIIYRWKMRHEPPSERVGILAVLPLSPLMVITYAILTPLALFTLDTASWETRAPEKEEAEDAAAPVATPVVVTGSIEPLLETITAEIAVGEPGRARARSHAQTAA
jgi:cellulose synthase/poly-beta-1,6-N-acetylglucosamine synthase-like glycosyltransferase